jgi:integrative and conjugative element protein (TIGR02256 family)
MSSVVFASGAARQLAELATLASDGLETGGVLLGHDRGLAGPILVAACGGPGPQAIRRRSYFRRDLAYARALAEQAATADGSAWIGEWHTHNTAMHQPSDRDLRTYREMLDDLELGFPRILAVIVLPGPATNRHAPAVHAWSFTGSVLRQLPISGLQPGARTTPQPGDGP